MKESVDIMYREEIIATFWEVVVASCLEIFVNKGMNLPPAART